MGADRNVTRSRESGRMISSGQVQRPKVLRWPNRQVIVGYAGRAEIDGQAMDEWLYDFIGHNLDTDLELLAHALKDRLEFALGANAGDEAMVLHLAGFVVDRTVWTPRVWFIRNMGGLDAQGWPIDVSTKFDVSEEISQEIYFGDRPGNEIRNQVAEMARRWQPFWFHQGFDLGTFNALDQAVRLAMRNVVEGHPGQPHRFPDSVEEWSKHLEMAIRTYGAYFASFREPFEQLVGGGADVVWAEWPEVDPI